MSEIIYDNVIRTESEAMKTERVEMTVAIYESSDCVGDHPFRIEKNTHQLLQHTGNYIHFFDKNITNIIFLVLMK